MACARVFDRFPRAVGEVRAAGTRAAGTVIRPADAPRGARARALRPAARRAAVVARARRVRSAYVISGIAARVRRAGLTRAGLTRTAAASRATRRRTALLTTRRAATRLGEFLTGAVRMLRPSPVIGRYVRGTGTRRVVSRTTFAPRVRTTLRTTTDRDATLPRGLVASAARERGDMRRNSAAVGRRVVVDTDTPGKLASALPAM